jgi:hypothetical protein
LIQVFLPGDIRYSVLRGPHLVELELGLGLPWSLTQNGASVEITGLDALWSSCYWVVGWLLGLTRIGGSQWWAL